METKSLYGLASELQSLENLMLECEHEVDQEIIATKQQELVYLLQKKTDSVVGYRQYLDDGLTAVKRRIDELLIFENAIKSRINRYEDYVKDCMKLLGVSKIEGELCSISLSKPTQKVEILDEDTVKGNIEFINVKEVIEINKTKIKEALKDGRKVEGAILTDSKQPIRFKTGK